MKKISEWLNELPEPYRTQALENYKNPKCNGLFSANEIYPSQIKSALAAAFNWDSSPEKAEYWERLWETL